MDTQSLFNRVVSLWPAGVDISERRQNARGRHWFPALAEANRTAEEAIDHTVDHWANVGAWAFYQAIVGYANEAYEGGERKLLPSSLSLPAFDLCVRKCLLAEGFENESGEYVGLS